MWWCAGLGGAFVLRAGRGYFHVMPDFSRAPLCSDAAVDSWLHYFELEAPLTVVGTLVTGDLVGCLISNTSLCAINDLIQIQIYFC